MDSSNFGDNATVVGDLSYKRQDETFNKEPSPHKPSTSRTGMTGKGRMHNEFTSTNYALEERPFFIPIQKDGVIAALNKLNKQLVEVRFGLLFSKPLSQFITTVFPQAGMTPLVSKKTPTDWTGVEVVPGQLGLINHG